MESCLTELNDLWSIIAPEGDVDGDVELKVVYQVAPCHQPGKHVACLLKPGWRHGDGLREVGCVLPPKRTYCHPSTQFCEPPTLQPIMMVAEQRQHVLLHFSK